MCFWPSYMRQIKLALNIKVAAEGHVRTGAQFSWCFDSLEKHDYIHERASISPHPPSKYAACIELRIRVGVVNKSS